jgi:hypothetical protein
LVMACSMLSASVSAPVTASVSGKPGKCSRNLPKQALTYCVVDAGAA